MFRMFAKFNGKDWASTLFVRQLLYLTMGEKSCKRSSVEKQEFSNASGANASGSDKVSLLLSFNIRKAANCMFPDFSWQEGLQRKQLEVDKGRELWDSTESFEANVVGKFMLISISSASMKLSSRLIDATI